MPTATTSARPAHIWATPLAIGSWLVLFVIAGCLLNGSRDKSRLASMIFGYRGNTGSGMREMFIWRQRSEMSSPELELYREEVSWRPPQTVPDMGRVEVFVRRSGFWALTERETVALWNWPLQPHGFTADQLRGAIASDQDTAERWTEDAIQSAATGLPVRTRLVSGVVLNVVSAIMLVAALASTPTAIRSAYVQLRTQRRMAKGFCGVCGYDLKEIASSRCPECWRD